MMLACISCNKTMVADALNMLGCAHIDTPQKNLLFGCDWVTCEVGKMKKTVIWWPFLMLESTSKYLQKKPSDSAISGDNNRHRNIGISVDKTSNRKNVANVHKNGPQWNEEEYGTCMCLIRSITICIRFQCDRRHIELNVCRICIELFRHFISDILYDCIDKLMHKFDCCLLIFNSWAFNTHNAYMQQSYDSTLFETSSNAFKMENYGRIRKWCSVYTWFGQLWYKQFI